MSKYHNTYQRIYQEKYRFLDTVTQPYDVKRVSLMLNQVSVPTLCFLV